jgi:hypothetical protein
MEGVIFSSKDAVFSSDVVVVVVFSCPVVDRSDVVVACSDLMKSCG